MKLNKRPVDAAAIPSSTFLGIAAGAMTLSLGLHIMGSEKWGEFIAQWVPTFLLAAFFVHLVKRGHPLSGRVLSLPAGAGPVRKDYSPLRHERI